MAVSAHVQSGSGHLFGLINSIVDSQVDDRQDRPSPSTRGRERAARRPQSLRLAESLLAEASSVEPQTRSVSNQGSDIDVAYSGLVSMKSMISHMQAIANAAAHTADPAEIIALSEQYDSAQQEVSAIAIRSKVNVEAEFKDGAAQLTTGAAPQKTPLQRKVENQAATVKNLATEEDQVVPEFKLVADENDPRVMKLVPVVPYRNNSKYKAEPEFKLAPDEKGDMQITPIVPDDPTPTHDVPMRSAHNDGYGIGLKDSAAFNYFARRNDIADAIVNMNGVLTKINAIIRRLRNKQSIRNLRGSITNSKIQLFQTGVRQY